MEPSDRIDSAPPWGHPLLYCPPPPDTKDIFRELIVTELRAGRLTRAGRARIVRFASQIGLSAVEAGRLIAETRRESLEFAREKTSVFPLRLAAPPPRRHAIKPHVAIITGTLLIIIWLIR